MPIGIPEMVLILVILLVIFGPKRLPGLGRSLGTSMREFKDSVTGPSKDDDERPALDPAPAPTAAAATPAPQPAGATAAERETDSDAARAFGDRS